MPYIFILLAIMLGTILIFFLAFRRPIYEAVLVSFLVLLTITGTWGQLPSFVNKALSTSLIYSMTAFVTMSIIMTKTGIIDSCVALILALLGRIPGGAGYGAAIASSFMGSLSGSGPGNIMATGSITIPAMKKSGFPAELAANIESNASYMGNMIPPSSNIVAALGAFAALYPEAELSSGQFWIILWGVSLWFIFQRLLTIFLFSKYYKLKPMSKEDMPELKQVFRKSWKGLLLPVIILLPFLFDYFYKDSFFTARLGAEGAGYLSSSILLFTAGIVSIYACLIAENKKELAVHSIARMFSDSVKSISPAIGVCVFGYMIGALFNTINLAESLEQFILSIHLSKFGMVVFVCIITCILGMVIPGSSIVVIFGSVFIATLASVGVNPRLAAAMLPCICGVMCGITPPLGLGMYAGMTIAESDFTKTFNNNLWWVAGQFILEVIVLMGWLPILGL